MPATMRNTPVRPGLSAVLVDSVTELMRACTVRAKRSYSGSITAWSVSWHGGKEHYYIHRRSSASSAFEAKGMNREGVELGARDKSIGTFWYVWMSSQDRISALASGQRRPFDACVQRAVGLAAPPRAPALPIGRRRTLALRNAETPLAIRRTRVSVRRVVRALGGGLQRCVVVTSNRYSCPEIRALGAVLQKRSRGCGEGETAGPAVAADQILGPRGWLGQS